MQMTTQIISFKLRARCDQVLLDVALKLTSPVHVATLGTHREAVFVAEGSRDKSQTSGGPRKIPTRDKIDPEDTGVLATPVPQ